MESSLLIGIVAGTLGISGFLYQVLKQSEGLTYPMIAFIGTSLAIWAVYGLTINDVIVSTVNFIMASLLGIAIWKKLRKK